MVTWSVTTNDRYHMGDLIVKRVGCTTNFNNLGIPSINKSNLPDKFGISHMFKHEGTDQLIQDLQGFGTVQP